MSECELLKEMREERDLFQAEARNHKVLLDKIANALSPDSYALSHTDIMKLVQQLAKLKNKETTNDN